MTVFMLQRTKEVGESFNLGVSTLSRVCQECNFVFTTEIGENRKRRLAGWDDDLETLDLTCTKLECVERLRAGTGREIWESCA